MHSLHVTPMSSSGPNPPHSAPTLSAVAKLAGVSSITVSRVVRLPNLVAPQTRGRVEAAIFPGSSCETNIDGAKS